MGIYLPYHQPIGDYEWTKCFDTLEGVDGRQPRVDEDPEGHGGGAALAGVAVHKQSISGAEITSMLKDPNEVVCGGRHVIWYFVLDIVKAKNEVMFSEARKLEAEVMADQADRAGRPVRLEELKRFVRRLDAKLKYQPSVTPVWRGVDGTGARGCNSGHRSIQPILCCGIEPPTVTHLNSFLLASKGAGSASPVEHKRPVAFVALQPARDFQERTVQGWAIVTGNIDQACLDDEPA